MGSSTAPLSKNSPKYQNNPDLTLFFYYSIGGISTISIWDVEKKKG